MKYAIVAIILFLFASTSIAAPVLNFSDIDSGPKSGNTDGVGSGAIVTIWGNNLGSTQSTSKVYVGEVEATAIYYWKDADGELPGGPADLKTYHKMQEIAFAIPAGAVDGVNTIKVTVGGTDSNTLPFTVRAGTIRFIKSTGTDTGNTTGSWTNPYKTLAETFAGGNNKIAAGDIVYDLGVGASTGLRVGRDVGITTPTADNPIALIAYPNTSSAFSGVAGDASVIANYYPSNRLNGVFHLSKLSVTAYGNYPAQCNGISVFPYGRIIGVEITGPNVYGGYGGAITGSNGVPQGGKYLGIYVHDYGYQTEWRYATTGWTVQPYDGVAGVDCTNCTTVDASQHLYYISNRTATPAIGYEIGWNHLTDNPILNGIHIYDQSPGVGWSTPIKIHHNVVKNQRSYAIDTMASTAFDVEIYSNLVITDADELFNVGPAFVIGTKAHAKIYNNTVYGYANSSDITSEQSDYRNNIMVDTLGVNYISGTFTSQSDNLFFSTGAISKPAWATTETGNIESNPLFANATIYDFSLQAGSPAIDAGYNTASIATTDFLGVARTSTPDIGAFGAGSGATDWTPPVTSHNGASRSPNVQLITLEPNETATTLICISATTCTPSLPYSAPVSVKPGKFLCFKSTDSAGNAETPKCFHPLWPCQ